MRMIDFVIAALFARTPACPPAKDTGADTAIECADTDGPWEFCADTDEDEYGDPNDCLQACTTPEGYVWDNTDCDDADARTNPDAQEICTDEKDNDCDGEVNDVDACGEEDHGIGKFSDLEVKRPGAV